MQINSFVKMNIQDIVLRKLNYKQTDIIEHGGVHIDIYLLLEYFTAKTQ